MEEDMKGVEIIGRLNKHYSADALQRMQVCHWIKQVKSGRNDLSNVSPPGRAPDEALNDCIAKALEEDPHLSTRKIAKTLNVSSTTVPNHLTKSLEMKCYHMRWAHHAPKAAQKAKRTEMAGSMLQTLESHTTSNARFPWTCDKSQMFYEYRPEMMWDHLGTKWTNLSGRCIIPGRRS
jgi:hypothetical protein